MQLTQHFVATTENMRILIFKVLDGGRSLCRRHAYRYSILNFRGATSLR